MNLGGYKTERTNFYEELSIFSVQLLHYGNCFAQQDQIYLVRRTLKRNAHMLVVKTARVDILLARQIAKREVACKRKKAWESAVTH